MFGRVRDSREFLPNIGAFLVAIPILLVALSLGATKFWLALGVDRSGLPGRAKRSCTRRAGQRDAITSGHIFVLNTLATATMFGLLGVFLAVPAAALGADRDRRIFICNRANSIMPDLIAKPQAGGREVSRAREVSIGIRAAFCRMRPTRAENFRIFSLLARVAREKS
jgi:hypothetical protein